MINKERAEEILQTKGSMTFCAKGCEYTEKVIELIAVGLAEGRKEVYEELQWVTDTDNYIASKLERLRELEKENAELKAKLKWHDSENDFPPDMSDTGRFSINVWSSKKEVVYYDHVEQVWMSFDSDEVTNVTAWIEIPEYEL